MSIGKRRAQYINVGAGSVKGERRRSAAALSRSIRVLTALCLVLLLTAVGYSAVKYMDEHRDSKLNHGGHDEQNTVKRQYIVPSAQGFAGDEEYRPAGYSGNIGTALAARLEAERSDAGMRYDTVIDTTEVAAVFDRTYPLCDSEEGVVYWSDVTAYRRYLSEVEDIRAQLAAGDISNDEAQGRLALLRDDYAMTMLDYRSAGSEWINKRRRELGALYTEIADGKYYAQLLASEIYAMADEGFRLLGVGDERAGIDEEYEKYLDDVNAPLLWYVSRCGPDEHVEIEYRIRYADGHPKVPRSNLRAALEKRLRKADIDESCIVEESIRAARVQDAGNGHTAALCRLRLTKEEILRLLELPGDGVLSYSFTDGALLAEYRRAVYGDGFARRTELVRLAPAERQA